MATATAEKAPSNAAQKPEALQLRSVHDYSLTLTSLEHRVEELKKLAKKNMDEGYEREARAINADILSIEQHILPCFRNQRELPLVSHEQLQDEILGALRRHVTQAFEGLGDPKVLTTPEMIAHRRENLLKRLAVRVTLFVNEVVEDGYNQGFAAREQTSESIAMRGITTLRASET